MDVKLQLCAATSGTSTYHLLVIEGKKPALLTSAELMHALTEYMAREDWPIYIKPEPIELGTKTKQEKKNG